MRAERPGRNKTASSTDGRVLSSCAAQRSASTKRAALVDAKTTECIAKGSPTQESWLPGSNLNPNQGKGMGGKS